MNKNWIGLLAFVAFIVIIAGAAWLGDYLQRRDEKKAIEEGRLRILGNAEYLRSFGVRPKLRVIRGGK